MPFGRRPTATSTRSKTSEKLPFGPSIVTSSPVSSAFTAVTFDFRWIASYCFSIRLKSGLTMSASAPGMIWSMNSTMVIFAPIAS